MIYYKNNYGQTVYLDRLPYQMLSNTDLFDYEWSYETKNELNPQITRFFRNMVQKKISVRVVGGTEYENAVNELTETFEKDVVNITAGKLYVDNAYISCYVIKNTKAKAKRNPTVCTVEFTLICEKGSWITENKTSFRADTSSNDGNLNFPYNYPYNYATNTAGKKVMNPSYQPSDFEMIIYGACSNPSISIGGHLYNVNCSLEIGEYLCINSIAKTICKIKSNGDRVNQFSLRNRDSYTFEKIQPGENAVTWSGLFGFDVTLLSERSEPLWI